ncbi:hypothetical protein F5Y14DRAFT_447191 [Nemania sp. NC0429]|nr:hypothetical protein F5Y14DRAFT_447191 [Nemania sp. NC0429]
MEEENNQSHAGGSQNGDQEKLKINVGVETEAPLVVTREGRPLHLNEPLKELAKLFNEKGLSAYDSAVDHEHDHTKWAITIDSSIMIPELDGRGAPVEIKSPILAVDDPAYQDKVRAMWEIIAPFKMTSIGCWKLCSTHIHFSLAEDSIIHFSVADDPDYPIHFARKLAFCVVYFEDAIDDLMPAMTHKADTKRPGGWKDFHRYARRNKEAIFCARNGKELNDLMCWDEDEYRRKTGCGIKSFKWSFKGFNFKTIEFRQMPPCRSAQETLDWITFLTAFVRAAAGIDEHKLSTALDDPKCTFAEGLGLKPSNHWLKQDFLERSWAHRTRGVMDWTTLKEFVDCDDGVWTRIIAARDQIEKELAALPD